MTKFVLEINSSEYVYRNYESTHRYYIIHKPKQNNQKNEKSFIS